MKRLLFLSAILCVSFGAKAQQVPAFEGKDTGALIKASYLYNFSKLVDWPAEYKQGNFVISVMGGSNVHEELVKKYNNKQIGSQQIEIRKVSRTLNVSQCHVLFVGGEHIDFLPEITRALANSATLIVSDHKDALSKGAALNFVIVDANLKFELDAANATKRNLFIGSTLKSLALRVQ
jgi:hypothetical protein